MSYIKNWEYIFSWGQDASSDDKEEPAYDDRMSRGSEEDWYAGGFYPHIAWESDDSCGFRPILEIQDIDVETLFNGYQEITVDLNGGVIGGYTGPVKLVTGSSETAYSAPSGKGITLNNSTQVFGSWRGDDGKTYQPGDDVPVGVSLTAQWRSAQDWKQRRYVK